MKTKTTRIISIVLITLPSLLIAMSGIMKLVSAEQIVIGLTKAGLGSYIKLFGLIELVSLVLLIYPKTHKIGFLLLCCYLGGAMSIELAGGEPPMAAFFLVFMWIGEYLKNKLMFVKVEQETI